MSEESMIERVAKAKWARRQEVGRKAGIVLADWDDELEALREEVRAETRAGIAAMREPTYPMIDACYEVDGLQQPIAAWNAMIDAALGEKA